MEKHKLDRINVLAKKAKNEPLTDEEKAEQAALRDEYRAMFRKNFETTLDHTYVVDKDGKKTKFIKDKAVEQ